MHAYYLEIAVVGLGLFLLMAEAFMKPSRNRRALAWIGAIGLGVVFVASFSAHSPENAGSPFWRFYSADAHALFYKRIALLTTIGVLLMAVDYAGVLCDHLTREARAAGATAGLGEFYALPVFTCAGLMWMASATDLISIFISLEMVTMSFYVLVAYMRRNVGSLEAGVKYLILGALSTGFFVYGITWTFGVTGHTHLAEIAASLGSAEAADAAPILFGFALLLVGLGFKVGAVPFQIWIPDVYQGAPTPVTAFLSVASKAAGFIVLLRIVAPFLEAPLLQEKVVFLLVILAAATLVYGNLAAIPQTNLKRLLAYSSISHAGFLLMAIACAPSLTRAGTLTPATVVSFYLGTYLLMTLLCFFVVNLVRGQLGRENLDAFNGLGRRSPFLAFAMLVGMISLAGVPLTAGFFGKFFIFQLAVADRQFGLVAIAVVGVAAGFYYYLKVVRSMYWNEPDDAAALRVPLPTKAAIAVLVAAVLFFGIYPAPILDMLR